VPRLYASAEAVRRALEARLNRIAKAELIQINRLRRQVAFDRLLARLFRVDPAPWVLKGGYALELRFRTARATVDIDLTVERVAPEATANQIVRDMLQEAANSSLDDWFEIHHRCTSAGFGRSALWRGKVSRQCPDGRQDFCALSSGCWDRRRNYSAD